MILRPWREPARVLMHLNGGYTKVSLERFEGVGLANGGIEWDIPTRSIPPHLRGIGSRFLVVTSTISPEANDSPDELRAAIAAVTIEELTEG
ncbi:MAG TPA: hypothetical protein VKA46_39200 [Gemmataceae bacterium]|nr:hypothetical protein [Gemmataceae bacterium]